ncbi:hypothetical protein [Bradyrhizobium sp.]
MALSTGGSVTVPSFQADEKIHRRKIAEWCKLANQGHIPVTGSVTLKASSTTTVVNDQRCGPLSHVSLTPTTAKGASAMPGIYITPYIDGAFTINHASTATTTKSFTYSILGA